MDLDKFNYNLPEELIAQTPASPRGTSRLLHVNKSGIYKDLAFKDIIGLLRAGDVLVLNNTKVLPTLLIARRYDDIFGSEIRITLIKQIAKSKWQILAKPAKKLKVGTRLGFYSVDLIYTEIEAIVIEKDVESNYVVIEFQTSEDKIFEVLLEHGGMPLPPYIRRESELNDKRTYQTVYAAEYGAVAAPTAGLHFSDQILQQIQQNGVQIAFVTLHIGLGTFMPVKVQNIEDHVMHTERFILSEEVCQLINKAKSSGNRVIAVGTTSMRVLESCAKNDMVAPMTGETNIFIKPGYKFNIVDALLTNFHLPKSTLLMLVCAFAGYENIMNAYAHAIEKKYNFFSYGDANFIERGNQI